MHFHPKLSAFPNNNFLFSQKQPPAKLSHFMTHITCCPPKSEHAFSKTPTNPYAVKHAFRTGSKYSELYGTRLRFLLKFLDRHTACVLVRIFTARNFEPRSQGGAPSAFGYFSQRRKVTENRPFGSFCRSKKNVKTSPFNYFFVQAKK